MLQTCALVVVLATAAFAQLGYQFAADSETILSQPLQNTFDCGGRPYGYYADIDNNCEVFHVCLPVTDEIGDVLETVHFSFVCGNQTIFSQESLTCTHPEEALPCQESQSLYGLVEFGKQEGFDGSGDLFESADVRANANRK